MTKPKKTDPLTAAEVETAAELFFELGGTFAHGLMLSEARNKGRTVITRGKGVFPRPAEAASGGPVLANPHTRKRFQKVQLFQKPLFAGVFEDRHQFLDIPARLQLFQKPVLLGFLDIYR